MTSRPAARPLRLLLTTDVVGGVWDYGCTLARELGARGHTVLLFALGGTPSDSQQRQAHEVGALLEWTPLKLEWMQDCAADVAASQQRLATLAADWQPDVVHASQFVCALAKTGVPVLLTLHSDVLSWRTWSLSGGQTGPVPAEWQPYVQVVEQALQAADALVAVSGFLADETRRHYALPGGQQIDVVHNGWLAPDGEPASPASTRGRTTLLAGRLWDRGKNVALAAEAAARLPRPGAVHLAGEARHPDGGQASPIPAPLQPLGFLPRAEMDRALASSRVYLSAARYDPFGLLPLQAALAGCALLLSDIPSYREVWDDAALYASPEDPLELAAAWQRLLDQADLADEMAQRARARALERYTPARMADHYERIYRRLLARGRVTSMLDQLAGRNEPGPARRRGSKLSALDQLLQAAVA